MTPTELISTFVNDKLNGDINRLATFPLCSLRNDIVYGCPERKFDSDDTELMRAIYCVAFGETWKNLSMGNIDYGKLRGDTLNTYNTLFSSFWKERFTSIWNPDEELVTKIKTFHVTAYTIGNMAVLPDRRIGEWSINMHRGCHDDWHDYEDRFLAALHKVLTKQEDRDLDLDELVQLNNDDFEPFYGEEGWRRFIDGNMLEYYVDDDCQPVISSKGYTFWRGGYTNRGRFFEECHRFIDFSTEVINNRAKRMIEKIKQKLSMVEEASFRPYIEPIGNEYPSYKEYVNSQYLDSDIICLKLMRGEREPQNEEEKLWKQELNEMKSNGKESDIFLV